MTQVSIISRARTPRLIERLARKNEFNMAITSEKKSNVESSITPRIFQRDRPDLSGLPRQSSSTSGRQRRPRTQFPARAAPQPRGGS